MPIKNTSLPIGPMSVDSLSPGQALGVTSQDMLRIVHLSAFFGGRKLVPLAKDSAGAIGWGIKRSGRRAEGFATRTNRPFALLEDGFLRSVGLGKTGAAPVSIVIDDCGMYYDASRPSRVEQLIAARTMARSTDAGEQAANALERWRGEGLSKYNIGSDMLPVQMQGKIILVDQVMGDMSVAGAGAGPKAFERMIALARQRGLLDKIIVRSHPDVTAGKATGYLFELARKNNIPILADDCSPPVLLKTASAVWTVSSALGFEALIQGVEVVTFGMPFYAGWGLTEDLAEGNVAQSARSRRCFQPDMETLFGAALLDYPRYADPVTKKATDFHGAVDRILDWRQHDRDRAGPALYCFGFSGWKQASCAALLGGSQRKIIFAGSPKPRALKRMPAGAKEIAVWGLRETAKFRAAAELRGLSIQRVEDGFVRSVGLGSDLLGPASIALDGPHLYFDCHGESRLERILETYEFSPELLERAQSLAQRIVGSALTKYNMPSDAVDLGSLSQGRRIVAVVEQVPNDASIRLGGGVVEPNLDLLRHVRGENPDAFIVYKKHPDLISGNRRGRTPNDKLQKHADLVLSRGDLGSLYAQIDELNVITSLAGFEALLRGVSVTTWGLPFYAGWGLTNDRASSSRRTRRLSLPQLVAGALILYPRYVDPVSLTPCSVEDVLDVINRLRMSGAGVPAGGLLRRSKRVIFGYLRQLLR